MKCKELKAILKKNNITYGKKGWEFMLKTSSEKYRKKQEAKLWEFKPIEYEKDNFEALTFLRKYVQGPPIHFIRAQA